MKQTRLLMGMPITLEVLDERVIESDIADIFDYFISIDNRFSTYKKDSEISQINRGEKLKKDYSSEMKLVLLLCEQTKQETKGYFDIHRPDGTIDPSGLVKGWAIQNSAKLLKKKGFSHFSVNAGGDAEVSGTKNGQRWTVGIRNPFHQKEIVKVLQLSNSGIATSGSYIRGQHVYNPFSTEKALTEIVSMTVIGPNVYDADRFATACFAMQRKGLAFIASLSDFSGYMIDKDGIATYTKEFEQYVAKD